MQDWECPNCDAWLQSPTNRHHYCPGLKGLAAPFVLKGTAAKVEAIGREDYVGTDIPQRDGEGNVVMAIETTRDDGTDVAVLAPTATGSIHDG